MSVSVLVSSLSLQAQNFDEGNLVGKWERSAAMQPVDNYIVSIDTLYFGTKEWIYESSYGIHMRYASGVYYGQSYVFFNPSWISDFSITNGDKLHIGLEPGSNGCVTLIFKIVSLTPTELVIQPLGSSNQIRFQKKSTPTSINAAKISTLSGDETIYDMTGTKLTKKNKGMNIIKPNNGAAYKEIVK